MFILKLKRQIQRFMSVCRVTGLSPLFFKDGRFVYSGRRLYATILCIMSTWYGIGMAWNTRTTYRTMSNQDKVILGVWGFLAFVWFLCDIFIVIQGEAAARFLNALFQYESQRPGWSAPGYIITFGKIMIWIATFTNVLLGPAILIGTTVLPNTPPFLSSWYFFKGDANKGLVRLVSRLLETSLWSTLVTGATFCACFYTIVGMAGVMTYVNLLRGARNATLDELSMEYRTLQILMHHYNATTSGFLVPSLLFAYVGAEILMASATILYSHQLLSQPLLLWLPVFVTYVVIYVAGWGYVAGYTYEGSKLLLKECRGLLKDLGGRERRLMERVLRQLVPLKMKFGSNFMEMSSPLVIASFISSGIVQLLLIHRDSATFH